MELEGFGFGDAGESRIQGEGEHVMVEEQSLHFSFPRRIRGRKAVFGFHFLRQVELFGICFFSFSFPFGSFSAFSKLGI
jgi:hypothetical protein